MDDVSLGGEQSFEGLPLPAATLSLTLSFPEKCSAFLIHPGFPGLFFYIFHLLQLSSLHWLDLLMEERPRNLQNLIRLIKPTENG